jgi:hypothetical protein
MPASTTAQASTRFALLPKIVPVADIDQNGRPDLIVANSGSNTVSVLLINTTASGSSVPSFAPIKILPPRTVRLSSLLFR